MADVRSVLDLGFDGSYCARFSKSWRAGKASTVFLQQQRACHAWLSARSLQLVIHEAVSGTCYSGVGRSLGWPSPHPHLGLGASWR